MHNNSVYSQQSGGGGGILMDIHSNWESDGAVSLWSGCFCGSENLPVDVNQVNVDSEQVSPAGLEKHEKKHTVCPVSPDV